MTTETSPRPLQGERPSPARQAPSDGLEPVRFLHDADGKLLLPPFPLFEVERPASTPVRTHPEPPGLGLWLWIVGGLLAPFAVLLGALSLPVSDTVRGVALVVGWVLLGIVVRWSQTRRRHRR